MAASPALYWRRNGRRHFNKVRRIQVRIRQGRIARTLRDGGFDLDTRLGTDALVTSLALEFGVSRTTIYRDLRTLRSKPVCPVCGKPRD